MAARGGDRNPSRSARRPQEEEPPLENIMNIVDNEVYAQQICGNLMHAANVMRSLIAMCREQKIIIENQKASLAACEKERDKLRALLQEELLVDHLEH